MADEVKVPFRIDVTGQQALDGAAASATKLGGASAGTQTKLDAMKRELEMLNRVLPNTLAAQQTWIAQHGTLNPNIQRSIDYLKQKQSALQQAAAGMGQASGSAHTLASAVGSMALGMTAAAAVIGVSVVAALARAAYEAVQFAAESVLLAAKFETAMTKVSALTEQGKQGMEGMTAAVLGMAGAVGKTPQELAEGLYFITSSGLSGAVAMDALKLSATGSAVGMGQTKDVAMLLAAILNAYGPTGMTASRAMDILTETIRQGGAEADQYAHSMGRVIGIGASFGIKLEELSAFVATFTRTVPSASEAVTSLRQTLLNLMAPSNQTKDQLAQLGLTAKQVSDSIRDRGLMVTLQELIGIAGGNIQILDNLIPNVRALAGVMNTAGAQAEAYKGILEAIENSSGSLNDAFEKVQATLQWQWDSVTAEFLAMKTAVGISLTPALQTLAGPIMTGVKVALIELRQHMLTSSGLWENLARSILPGVVKAFATVLTTAGIIIGDMLPALYTNFVRTSVGIEIMSSKLYYLAAAAMVAKGDFVKASEYMAKAQQDHTRTVVEAETKIRDFHNAMGGVRGALDAGAKAALASAAGLHVYTGDGLDPAAEAAKKAKEELDKLYEQLRRGAEITDDTKDAKKRLAEELKHTATNIKELERWTKALVEGEKKLTDATAKTLTPYEAQVFKLNEAREAALAKAQADYFASDATGEARVEIGRLYDALVKNIEATADAAQAAADLAIAKKLAAAAAKQQAAELKFVEAALARDRKATEEYADALRQLGATNAAVLGAIGDLFVQMGMNADAAFLQILDGFSQAQSAAFDFAAAWETQDLGGMIMAGIKGAGALIQIGKGIFDAFTSSPAEKAAKEAGKLIGGEFTEEMGQEIVDNAARLGISIHDAILLGLDEVMEESGNTVSHYIEQIGDLLSLSFEPGTKAAKDWLDSVESVFEQAVEEGTVAGDRMAIGMIQALRARGEEMPQAMADMVEAGLNKATSNLAAVFKGLDLPAKEGALLFASTFMAVFAEQGLIAAVEQLTPAWDAMQESIGELGEEALAALGPIPELMGIINDDTKPIIEGVTALQQVMNGLAEAGYMTTGAFAGLQAGAQAAFEQLQANGMTEQQALLTIAPMLADLKRNAEVYGVELDENTRRLIEQAEAAGVAFPTDPMLQVIDLLKELVLLMGGTLPDSATKTGTAFKDTFKEVGDASEREFARVRQHVQFLDDMEINIPVNYEEGGVPAGPPPGAQHGAVVSPRPGGWPVEVGGRPFIAGEGGETELIAPVRALAQAIGAGLAAQLSQSQQQGGGYGNLTINLTLDGDVVSEFVSEGTRTGRIPIYESALVRK